MRAEDVTLVNEGAVAEQFVGQHLLSFGTSARRPELYYWRRQARSSNAEVDFLVNVGGTVVPVEVKAGAAGRLRSLRSFVEAKRTKVALRFHAGAAAVQDFYGARLVTLPLYMIGQAERHLLSAAESFG